MDFCEDAITPEAVLEATSAQGKHLELDEEVGRAIAGALEDWLGVQEQVAPPADLVAVYEAVKEAIVPTRTIPARGGSLTCHDMTRTSICVLALLGALGACGQREEVPEDYDTRIPPPPEFQAPSLPTTDWMSIVQRIPPNASREQIDAGLERFLPLFFEARSSEMPQAVAALAVIKDQPQLVASLVAHYDTLPATEYALRVPLLGIIGEVQRPDAMSFLHKTIWTPLPEPEPLLEGPTRRDLEEMVRVKAVQGMAYLRTPEAEKALIQVMQRHESNAVKIAAIDAYMWNHGGTDEAAQSLYQVLHPDLHKFVQQPRFHRGIDRERFNQQLQAWHDRWGSAPQQ